MHSHVHVCNDMQHVYTNLKQPVTVKVDLFEISMHLKILFVYARFSFCNGLSRVLKISRMFPLRKNYIFSELQNINTAKISCFTVYLVKFGV